MICAGRYERRNIKPAVYNRLSGRSGLQIDIKDCLRVPASTMKLPRFSTSSTQTPLTGDSINRLVTHKRHFHLFHRMSRRDNRCEVGVNTELCMYFMVECGPMRAKYIDDEKDEFFHEMSFDHISAML